MATKVDVLLELRAPAADAFAMHEAAVESEREAFRQSEQLVADLAGFGIEVSNEYAPVPMFTTQEGTFSVDLEAFAIPEQNADVPSQSIVIAAEVDRAAIPDLQGRGVIVWPNSPLVLFSSCSCAAEGVATDDEHLFDLAPSAGGIDCRPFRPAVSRATIRALLGVDRVWRDGFRGQNVVVGIIDEGVNDTVYPVIGGFSRPNSPRPGSAPITSHGSMCAADVLVAAPAAKLYDYPFLGHPNSGGALTMFQAVLDHRRIDGTPHLTNNSYGFVGRPPKNEMPNHEVWDPNHPVHRKVREVVASGAPAFFAAGNCGEDCPSSKCHVSGIGPGNSIHASNSLQEVITVAAVNSRHQRIGYSSQGPGGFFNQKPDIAAYSHFFGNFGPGRPAGGDATSFDNGTSAATPVAVGVGALLMSAFPDLTPPRMKAAMIQSAINIGQPGFDHETGFGVMNAAVAYNLIRNGAV